MASHPEQPTYRSSRERARSKRTSTVRKLPLAVPGATKDAHVAAGRRREKCPLEKLYHYSVHNSLFKRTYECNEQPRSSHGQVRHQTRVSIHTQSRTASMQSRCAKACHYIYIAQYDNKKRIAGRRDKSRGGTMKYARMCDGTSSGVGKNSMLEMTCCKLEGAEGRG